MTTSTTKGPLRFALQGERSVAEQWASLTADELACVETLKSRWEKECPHEPPFDDYMILRFARNSPGKTKFNAKTAWKVMKRFDRRFEQLKAADLEQQLLTKTLFCVPGLKTLEGNHAMFYMRPSRYAPSETSTATVINNLAYAMNTLCEAEKECKEGIGFLANMQDWNFHNFGVNYCYQFMMMLQGRIPVRVRLFLIVDPPSWFDKIWKIMKPMLAADFRKKVHMIPAKRLDEFLQAGFQAYLPDEVEGGTVPTDALVQDFVTYRKQVEADGEQQQQHGMKK